MSAGDSQEKSTLIAVADCDSNDVKTTISTININLDGNELPKKTSSVDQLSTDDPEKNPFTSSGKLSRKADYIISHSTITRSELRISDPDVPRKGQEKCTSEGQLSNGEVIKDSTSDEPLIVPSKVLLEEKQPAMVNGYTNSPVEAEVSQTLIEAPEKDKAEQIKLVERRKCCDYCRKCCRQCCIMQ